MESSDPITFLHKASIKDIIITHLVGLAKVPIFTALFTISFFYTLCSKLILIKKIRDFVVGKMCGIAYRVMLFLTGLFTIYVQPTSVTDRFSAVAENRDPESGDIIIANCSSYLNILWLQSTYNPIFAIPVSPTEVVTKTIHQLLNEILSVKPLTKGRKITFTQLIEYAKKEQKPIVLFPEAAVTNGKCVIKFQTFGQDTDFSDTRFHIFGFVHFDGKLNPNFTKGPGLYHLFLMIGRIVSGLKVKVVEESEIPKLENNKIDAKWISKCRNILATIMGVPMVDVDGMEIDNSGVKKVHKD